VEPRETATKPIRPGLFTTLADGSAVLLGSRDPATGECFWPAEAMNPRTRAAVEPAEIPGAGRIVACTTVARGLPGFASPYALACIALDAGPSLIAQLEDGAGAQAGMRVALVIGTIKTEKDGTRVIGPKFRPLAA
jgi:uncharacterized OB-fold protein